MIVFLLQDTLIPTMPQDDLAEIKETLLSAIRTSDYNATIYRMIYILVKRLQ